MYSWYTRQRVLFLIKLFNAITDFYAFSIIARSYCSFTVHKYIFFPLLILQAILIILVYTHTPYIQGWVMVFCCRRTIRDESRRRRIFIVNFLLKKTNKLYTFCSDKNIIVLPIYIYIRARVYRMTASAHGRLPTFPTPDGRVAARRTFR